jgi:hypothetical protein
MPLWCPLSYQPHLGMASQPLPLQDMPGLAPAHVTAAVAAAAAATVNAAESSSDDARRSWLNRSLQSRMLLDPVTAGLTLACM